jgi:hypothetical protein
LARASRSPSNDWERRIGFARNATTIDLPHEG